MGKPVQQMERREPLGGAIHQEGAKAIETVGKGDSPLLPQKSGQGVGRDL